MGKWNNTAPIASPISRQCRATDVALYASLLIHSSFTAPSTANSQPIRRQCRVAYIALYASLLSSLVAFPLGGYKLGPRYAVYLISLYGLFLLTSVLVEMGYLQALICW